TESDLAFAFRQAVQRTGLRLHETACVLRHGAKDALGHIVRERELAGSNRAHGGKQLLWAITLEDQSAPAESDDISVIRLTLRAGEYNSGNSAPSFVQGA